MTSSHAGLETKNDGISPIDVANLVLRRRRVIILSTIAGVLLGFVFAVRAPLEYTATASFIPHRGDQGGLSGMSSLAQQFGFSIPRSGAAERSPEFYQDLLFSREILDGLVMPRFQVSTSDGVVEMDLAEHFQIDGATPEERRSWTRRHLTEEIISVSVAQETGVLTIRVQTDVPDLSAAIGRRLLDLISTFDVETRQSHATAERGFAEERLRQLGLELSFAEDSLEAFLVENRQFSNSPQLSFEHDRLQRLVAMRQELVTAMAQAYEQARIDEVRNTPVITVIDHPESPALPDSRGRFLKLFFGLTLGLTFGFVFAFARERSERFRIEGSDSYGELQRHLADVKGDLLGLRRSH